MSLTATEQVIVGIHDRNSYLREALLQAAVGGTGYWTRTDASGDATYENWTNNADATTLDEAFAAIPLGQWSAMRQFLANHSSYFTTAVTATPPGLGLAQGLDAWLTARRMRLDHREVELLSEAGQSALSIANVTGRADEGSGIPGLQLGDLLGDDTFTAGTDMDILAVAPTAIQGRVTVLGSADWNISVECLHADGIATTVITQTVIGTGTTGAVGDTYVIGEIDIDGAAASGQKVVPVSATTDFTAGEEVLMTEWTGSDPDEVWTEQEVGTIASISGGVSLTMVDNLLHTYSASGFVRPLFTGVSDATDISAGAASDRIFFYPKSDRRLRL